MSFTHLLKFEQKFYDQLLTPMHSLSHPMGRATKRKNLNATELTAKGQASWEQETNKKNCFLTTLLVIHHGISHSELAPTSTPSTGCLLLLSCG